jgi:hypothetical protein
MRAEATKARGSGVRALESLVGVFTGKGRVRSRIRSLLEPWIGMRRVQLREPRPTIDVQDVVPWHEWGQSFVEWRRFGRSYCPSLRRRPRVGTTRLHSTWACELSQVDGFAGPTLGDFPDLNTLVERACPDLVREVKAAEIPWHLSHFEVRTSASLSNSFVCHRWDGRVYIEDRGDPYHFAAARFIACRLGVKVPLAGRLREHSLDEAVIRDLRDEYDLFVIAEDRVTELEFHSALAAVGVTYLTGEMPDRYVGTRAVMFPKSEKRSREVANLLREGSVFDLGAFLDALVRRQKGSTPRPLTAGQFSI